MNIPSYNALLDRTKLLRTVMELCQDMSTIQETEVVSEDDLLTNNMTEEQEKTAGLNAVAQLCVMYGYTATTSSNPEYTEVILDSEDHILMGRKANGKLELFGKEYD